MRCWTMLLLVALWCGCSQAPVVRMEPELVHAKRMAFPLACGPAPGGTLVPTGVPGQYSAAFNNVTLSAGCGTSFEWTIRLWFDWGGLGGPLVIPVLTALLSCTGC